jgi:hypothetical protein
MLKKFYIGKLYYNLSNITLIYTLCRLLTTGAQVKVLNTEADLHV